MQKIIALYLDKLNEHMEKMLLDLCPPDVEIRFLEPTIGKKGELKDADCVFDTIFKVTKDIIDQAPRLKLIQRTGVGVDMVDVVYAKEKNIPVSICKGLNSSSVAELAILGMLALYRKIVIMDTTTKQGKWLTWKYRHESYEIRNKVVGVLGAGTIGRDVIKRLSGFEPTIIYYDAYRLSPEQEKELNVEYVEFDELIKRADIITIHIPLMQATIGLFGEKEFKNMKPNAILINTARGPIVDQKALRNALENKEIAGAFLDVFEDMPAKSDDPLFSIDCENLICTPHIGAATYDNYYRGYKFCFENIQRIGRGEEPLFTV